MQSGHEDKRAHGNKASGPASGSGRRGRKSVGGDDTPSKGSKDSKAARRKEQNRAAQKAFRERREAKVKTVRVPLQCVVIISDHYGSWKTRSPNLNRSRRPRMSRTRTCADS